MFFAYWFSDFTAFVLYRIVGYRKKVIKSNINRCYPELPEKEKNEIIRKNYKNLSDMLVESIKGYTMSKKNMADRFRVQNLEILDEYFAQGKSVIGLTAHYSNWEWGAAAATTYLKHQTSVLYKPLSNKLIDKDVRENRMRFGVNMVSIYNTLIHFRSKPEKPECYFMVADQSPSNTEKAYWIDFFGIPTGFLHGPENYSKMLNIPVLYFEVQREKRGQYVISIHKLAENPTVLPSGELTLRYAEILEKIIRKCPESWVWTHKRWKHDLPENKTVYKRINITD
jgi:KDO2-lipid IV(A) lauroyltransferase